MSNLVALKNIFRMNKWKEKSMKDIVYIIIFTSIGVTHFILVTLYSMYFFFHCDINVKYSLICILLFLISEFGRLPLRISSLYHLFYSKVLKLRSY